MITGMFGVPGCGKSTFLAMIAQKELKKIRKGKSPYKQVLTNFPVSGCAQITFDDLGYYDIRDSLILFDEITLDADSRDFKSFPLATKSFFTLHRHFNNRIYYFCQDYSRTDKTIRNLTFDLWYIRSSVFPFFRNFSVAKRIYRNININEYTSELTLGYRFAKFAEIFFSKSKIICFRPRYYKYFDSFDEGQLSNKPQFSVNYWEV